MNCYSIFTAQLSPLHWLIQISPWKLSTKLCWLLYNRSTLLQVTQVPKVELSEQDFYGQNAIPVIKPTASKHEMDEIINKRQ